MYGNKQSERNEVVRFSRFVEHVLDDARNNNKQSMKLNVSAFAFEVTKHMTVISIVNLHLDGFVSVSQTAAWLTETTSLSEEIGLHLSEPFALKSLLLHHRQSGTLSSGTFHRKHTRNRKRSACSVHLFFFHFSLSCPLSFFHFPFLFLQPAAPPSSEEDLLLSTLALPASTGVERFTEPYSEDDSDYDNEEVTVALGDLEEDSDVHAVDWLPKNESG